MDRFEQFKSKFPEFSTLSNGEIVNLVSQYTGADPQRVYSEFGGEQNRSAVGDLGTALKIGVQRLPETVTGLGDVLVAPITGRASISDAADSLGRATGFRPGQWANDSQLNYSPAQQQFLQQGAQTEGFADTAAHYLTNPMRSVVQGVESVPGMALGGVYARGLRGLGGLGNAARFGAGEGGVMAGQAMNQMVEDGVDPARAAGFAALTGGLGGIMGGLGGRFTERLGGINPDQLLGGGGRTLLREGAEAPGLMRRVGVSALGEGAFEEMPQSAMEAAMGNLAAERPWDQDVGKQAAAGLVLGGLMGGVVGVVPPARNPADPIDILNRDTSPQAPTAPAAGLNLTNLAVPQPGVFSEPSQVEQWAGIAPAPTAEQHASRAEDILAAFNTPVGEVGGRPVTAWEAFQREQGVPANRIQTGPAQIKEAAPKIDIPVPQPLQNDPVRSAVAQASPATLRKDGSLKDIVEKALGAYSEFSDGEIAAALEEFAASKRKDTVWRVAALEAIARQRAAQGVPNVAQVDAASGQGAGAVPAGSAGNTPSGPVVLDGVRQPAGAPAPGSAARVPVGEPVVQQPASVEARQKLAGLQAFAQQVGSNVSADEISALPEQEVARLYDMIVAARRLNQEVGSEWTQTAQNWIEGAVRSSIASQALSNRAEGMKARVKQFAEQSSIASQALGNRVEGMKARAKQFAEQSAAERAAREARKKGTQTQNVPPTQQVAAQAEETRGKEGAQVGAEQSRDTERAQVSRIFDTLSEREREVLTKYHFDKMTFEEIGAELKERGESGTTRQRIEQQHKEALNKLAEAGRPFGLTPERLRLYFPDESRRMAGGADIQTASAAEVAQAGAGMTYRNESNNGAVNQANDEFEMADAVDGAEALDLDTDIAREEFDEGFRGEQGADVDVLEQVEAVESMARTERDHKGIPLQPVDFEDAASDYDLMADEGDTPFAELPRQIQVQWVKAWVAAQDGALTDQQLVRVFSEIADQYVTKAQTVEPGAAATAQSVQENTRGESQNQTDAREEVASTPAFRRWFGGSVVVDARGEPLVVYHGTRGDFSVFSEGEIGSATDRGFAGPAFYFTNNANSASSYAEPGVRNRDAAGGNVMPVYLKIERPYYVPEGQDTLTPEQEQEAHSGRYDGIINRLAEDDGYVEYAVFRPEQIKSATGNNGQFDGANPDIRYSRTSDTQGTTVEAVRSAINDIATPMGRRKVTVYQTADEAVQSGALNSKDAKGTQGWVDDKGNAFFIAGNIPNGSELAVVLHEIGAHLGIEKLLTDKQYETLVKKIFDWASSDANTQEARIARAAIRRVAQANIENEADLAPETIAYFVEEAVKAGVNPTAMQYKTELGRWFRTLWAAFKVALRRLNLINADRLTAQNVVDLAYGAARIELASTYHGTAANFRRFDHRFMGSGEGAQAFGWGTYLAQRFGIANEYFEADVGRKSGVLYKGEAIKQSWPRGQEPTDLETALAAVTARFADSYSLRTKLQKGTLTAADFKSAIADAQYELASDNDMAAHDALENVRPEDFGVGQAEGNIHIVDVNFTEDEMLDWFEPISKQRPQVREALEAVFDNYDIGIAGYDNLDMTGEQMYKRLSGSRGLGSDKAASEYLDSLGIKGIKFLDAKSRGKNSRVLSFEGKTYTTEDLLAAYGDRNHPLNDAAVVLRKVLSRGVDSTEAELQAQVDRTVETFVNAERESLEKFELPYNEAEARAEAAVRAKNSLYGRELAWLQQNKNRIQVVEPQKTRNLVVFNDRNIYRVGSMRGGPVDKGGRMMFSKLNTSTPEGFFDAIRNRTADFFINPVGFMKEHGLGWLTLEQLADVVKSKVVTNYHRVMVAMQQFSKDRVHDAALIDVEWAKLSPNEQRRLSTVMRGTTRASYDPENETPTNDEQRTLNDQYEALTPAAKDIYLKVRDYYSTNFEERKQILLDAANRAKAAGKNTSEVERMFAKVKGPYFPLMRIGGWYSVGMSPELADLMDKKGRNEASAAELKRIETLRKDAKHYVSRGHTTRRDAELSRRELQAQLGVAYANRAEERIGQEVAQLPDMAKLEEYIAPHLPVGVRSQVRDMLAQAYFDALPEKSALKRQLKREGVHGEEEDMRRVFAASALSSAHHISRLKYANDLSEAMVKVRAEGRRDETLRMVGNELNKRTALALEMQENPIVDRVLQVSYFANLGLSPAFLLTNMTQVPMITAPWLGARHGFAKATRALAEAFTDTKDMVRATYAGKGVKDGWRSEFDWSQKYPEGTDEHKLFRALLDRNLLDITMEHDLTAVAEVRNTKIDDAIKIANLPVRVTETVNRSITGLAAYRLARADGKSHEQAVEHAAKALSETQLNYSGLNTARHMQVVLGSKALARLMMQFRKFQQGMVYLIVKNAYDAVKAQGDTEAETKELRRIARRTLAGVFGTTGLMAGTLGLPFAGTVATVVGAVGGMLDDDDEPFDPVVEYRNFLTDMFGPEMAAVLAKGLPTLMNVDLSKRVGMGDIGTPLPFMRQGRTGTEAVNNTLGAAAGAWAGTTASMLDGIAFLANGDYAKAAEKIVPIKAAQNLVRGYRYDDQGLTNRNGELVVPAEKFSAWDIALRTAGFQPMREAEYYEANQAVEGAKRAAQDTRTKLLRQYAQAKLRGEPTADVDAEIKAFNERHPQKGLRIDYSARARAVQARRKMADERNEAGVRVDRTGALFEERGRFAAP